MMGVLVDTSVWVDHFRHCNEALVELLELDLGACRTWGVDSEKRPRRGQFLPISPGNSRTIAQENGEKWTGEAVLQPTILKSDRLLVLAHPLVVGEIACGTPPNRVQTLADLSRLQQPQQASMREALAFVERERLFGLGCGMVDMLLLASTLITPGAALWTLDKRLRVLAERFEVRHPSGLR